VDVVISSIWAVCALSVFCCRTSILRIQVLERLYAMEVGVRGQ
jgi:hypothetical protein